MGAATDEAQETEEKDNSSDVTEERASSSDENAGADPAAGRDIDDEDAGQIRVAFALVTLVAGIVCLVPRQWVSAVILLVLSASITVAHHRLKRARRTAEKKA